MPDKPLWRSERWNTIFADFLAQINNKTTQGQYDKTLRRFFAFLREKHGRAVTPDKVGQSDIEAFLRQPVSIPTMRAGHPLSPFSRNTYLMAIRSFYAYAENVEVEYRGKQMSALRGKTLPTKHIKVQGTGPADRDMDEGEINRFFAQIDRSTIIGKRDYAIFFALFATGRRRKEIAELLRGDMEPAIFYEEGKPRHGWMYQYLPKWRLRKERAEMPSACIEVIRSYHLAAGCNFDDMRPFQPIFFSIFAGAMAPMEQAKPIGLSVVDRRFRIYARAAGIPDNIVVHSLRHEHAWTRYNLNGHDILDVKNALGHTNVQTTLGYIEKRKRRVAGDPIASMLAAKLQV